jgi:hypothetical protein
MNAKYKNLYQELVSRDMTDLDENSFYNEYSQNDEKFSELYSYLDSNELTDLDPETFKLEYFGTPIIKKKSQVESTDSDSEVGSSERLSTTTTRPSVSSTSGKTETFTGYPGKEKNKYDFKESDGVAHWYEPNPKKASALAALNAAKNAIRPGPMGHGTMPVYSPKEIEIKELQYNKIPSKKIIEDDARVRALNKYFGKTASLDPIDQVYTNYDEQKKDNEYRVNDNNWQRKVPGAKSWTTVTDERAINALNRRYGKDVKYKAELKSVKPEPKLKFADVNTSLVSKTEEDAVGILSKKYGKYGFTFEQSGYGTDYIVAYNKDKTKEITVGFDEANPEEALKLKNFLEQNASKEKSNTALELEKKIKSLNSTHTSPSVKGYDILDRTNTLKYVLSDEYKTKFSSLSFDEMEDQINNYIKTSFQKSEDLDKFWASDAYKIFKKKKKEEFGARDERIDLLYTELQSAKSPADIKNIKSKISAYLTEDVIQDQVKNYSMQLNDLDKSAKILASDQKKYLQSVDDFNKLSQSGQMTQEEFDLAKKNLEDQAEKLGTRADFLMSSGKSIQNDQKKLNVVAGKYVAELSKSGGFFGGIMNSVLTGISKSIIEVPSTFVISLTESSGSEYFKLSPEEKQYYKDKGYSKDQTINLLVNNKIKDFKAETRKNLIDVLGADQTTQEYMKSSDRGFFAKAIFGVAESAPAMLMGVGGYAASFTGLAFQAYSSIEDEMLNDADFETSSAGERAVVAVPYAVLMGVLENFGLKNIVKGSSFTGGIIKDILINSMKQMPKDGTKGLLQNIMTKEVKSVLAKGAFKIVNGAIAEFETGATQSLVLDIGLKALYNKISQSGMTEEQISNLSGGEMFATPDTFGELTSTVLEDGLAEAIGGGTVSTFTTVVTGLKNGNISLYNEDDLNYLKEISQDSEFKKIIVANLKTEMLKGNLTKSEAQERLDAMNQLSSVIESIPDGLSEKDQISAVNILSEKNRLEKERQGKDPALVTAQTDRINEINEELKNISKNATKEDNIVQQEGTAEGGISEYQGTGEGQQEDGVSQGGQRETTINEADSGDSTVASKVQEELDAVNDRIVKIEAAEKKGELLEDMVPGELKKLKDRKKELESTPEAKIERRRQEDLSTYNEEGLNEVYSVGSDQTVGEFINAKYDAELAALGTTQKSDQVATLRAEEQAELLKAIPKIEKYKVDGKIDKTLMPKTVLAKYNKIYDKYDKLIRPLLETTGKVAIDKPVITTNTTAEVERVKSLSFEAEDGATFNIDGTKYEGVGLVVPVDSMNTTTEELTPEMVADFVAERQKMIGDAGVVKAGIYKFPNSNQVSIDLSVVVPETSREQALEFARLAGQESLFDLETFENIKTGATGENPMKFTPEQHREISKALKEGRMPNVFGTTAETTKNLLTKENVNEVTSKQKTTAHKLIVKAAKMVLNAIPGVKIYIHNNGQEMASAIEASKKQLTKEEKTGLTESSGLYVDGDIHINLESATIGTVYHEAFHALIEKNGIKSGSILLMAKGLKNIISDKGIKQRLDDFVSQYNEDEKAEEYISELGGILSEAEQELTTTKLQQFKTLINNIAKKLGLPVIFSASATAQDAADFINTMSKKLRTGEEIKDLSAEGKDGKIKKQAVDIMKGKESLEKFGLKKGKNITRKIGESLEARQRSKYGTISQKDNSPEARKKISNWMVDEVKYFIELMGDKSGKGWYGKLYQKSLDRMSNIFPEMKTDQNARDLFTMLVAITSDGQKVMSNFKLASEAYDYYKKNGVMPITLSATRVASFESNLKRINGLLIEYNGDIAAIKKDLMDVRSIQDINKERKKEGLAPLKTSWPVSFKAPFAASLFGAKLGMFYSNLSGNEAYPTLDRWWSRTFNRYRGTLIPTVNKGFNTKGEAIGLDRFKALLGNPGMSNEEALLASRSYRDSYAAKGYKDGTEVEKAANTIYKAAFENINDAPFNSSDRQFMYDTVSDAVNKLNKQGYDLSIADTQAILWYFEKNLYKTLGVQAKIEGISYEDAANYTYDKWKSAGEKFNYEIEAEEEGQAVEDEDIDDTDEPLLDKSRSKIKFQKKAPNGKPSKLNDVQWDQVRTPAFKKWFGDWENDPQNASKVVDENGEPRVVYHGSNAEFDEFKNRLFGYRGFYFTDKISVARDYGSNVRPFFLNSKDFVLEDMEGDNYSNNQWIDNLIETSEMDNKDVHLLNFIDPLDPSSKSKVPISNIYVIFNKSNIKLADGTNTTFDATQPSIKFQKPDTGDVTVSKIREASKKELLSRQKKMTIIDKIRFIRNKIIDRQSDIKRLIKGIGSKESIRAYNLLVSKAGASGFANYRFKNAEADIYKGLSKNDLDTLEDIIYARRMVAINESRAKKGLEPYTGMDGYSEVKALNDLDAIKNKIGEKKFNDLSKRATIYFGVFSENLKKLYESGRINEETYINLRDIEYSPIKTIKYIIGYNLDAETIDKEASKLGVSKKDIMALTDSNENAIIFDSKWLLLLNVMSVEGRAFENKMLNEFSDAIDGATQEQRDAISEFIIDNPIVKQTSTGSIQYKYNQNNVPVGYSIVSFFKNGVKKDLVVKEAYATQLLDIKSSNQGLNLIGTLTGAKILRFFATGGNPLFIIGNTAVDFQNILFFSDVYSKFKLFGGAQLSYDFVRKFLKGVSTSNRKNKIYNEYVEHGGAMDFLSNDGLRALKSLSPKNKILNISQKVLIGYGNIMSFLGEKSELAFRLAVYDKVKGDEISKFKKENGRDPDAKELDDIMYEATRNARETMDFNQGGSWVKAVDNMMPYLNASMQGFRRPLEYAKNNPLGFANSLVQASVMAGSIVALSLAALIRSFGDDDDEEKKKKILDVLDSLSDYEKATYHIIFTGKKNKDGEYEYYRIKKLPVLSVMSTITEQFTYKYLLSEAGIKYDVDQEVINRSIEASTPFSPSDIKSRNPLTSALITYGWNEDTFTGEKIFREPRDKKIAATAEGMYDDKVDQIYKEIAPSLGLSPIRTKAAIEKIVTSENTNPTISIFYASANGFFNKDGYGAEFSDAFSNVFDASARKLKRFTNKNNIRYKKEDNIENLEMIIETDIYNKEQKVYNIIKNTYKDGKELSNGELVDLIKTNFEKKDYKKYAKKYYTYIKNMNIDRSVLDILYEDTPEVQALRLYNRYGSELDSEEKKVLSGVMRKANMRLSKQAIYIYNKKYSNRK